MVQRLRGEAWLAGRAVWHCHSTEGAGAAWRLQSAGNDTMKGRREVVWIVYVRWDSGHWETIRTTTPEVVGGGRCWVMAMLPLPRVRVAPGKLRKAVEVKA